MICIVHHCPLFCFLLPIYLAHITDDTPDGDVYYATIQNSTLNLSLRNSLFFFYFLRPKKTRGKGQVEVSPDTQSSRSSMANKPERERVCVGAKEGNKTPRECARFWATNASVRSSGNSSFQAPPCPATSFLRLPAAPPSLSPQSCFFFSFGARSAAAQVASVRAGQTCRLPAARLQATPPTLT